MLLEEIVHSEYENLRVYRNGLRKLENSLVREQPSLVSGDRNREDEHETPPPLDGDYGLGPALS